MIDFWPAEKTKFWIWVLILTAAIAVGVAGTYGWIVYRQKVEDSNMNVNQQVNPNIAPVNFDNANSTNATESPGAPVSSFTK